MKLKSLLALALALGTIGLSFPAVAGDRDGHSNRRKDRQERRNNNYNYEKYYHYAKLKNSDDHIYIGRNGDYWDSNNVYHEASDNPSYIKYYDRYYNYKRYGKYFYEKKYYDTFSEP